ncbi:PREDICTED: bZIP transcription factor 11-like [Ipomoea nil]|uniref:bZIP transcription factor 11-like n=1 Tax=Ipomoea nil TaxID=35883 RepID=UPI000900F614|nr:PREDICTED: bZIP transcription factor 11-like [Ipomoea nil]
MACSSGTCSGSSVKSQEDSQMMMMMDQRKRKRMISNRESARRSRMKKQKLLDELTAQVSQLEAENTHILANLDVVTRLRLEVEAQNSVLMAQVAELNHRLRSLNQILSNMSPTNSSTWDDDDDDDFFNPWNIIPLIASPNAMVEY